jgi:hypothetical protein
MTVKNSKAGPISAPALIVILDTLCAHRVLY